jgi:hypothetical protein
VAARFKFFISHTNRSDATSEHTAQVAGSRVKQCDSITSQQMARGQAGPVSVLYEVRYYSHHFQTCAAVPAGAHARHTVN